MPKSSKPAGAYRLSVERLTEEQIPSNWLHDLELLRRLIHRSELVTARPDHVFDQKHYPVPNFKIATVSNLTTSDLVEEETLGCHIVVTKDQLTRTRLREDFLKQLQAAARQGANLVCYNELAYPTPLTRGERLREHHQFQERIQRLVDKHGLFLVAGSYHDRESGYNVCPIFSPYQSPRFTKKLTSAVRLKEVVRTPSERAIWYYETRFGAYSILVCLDACDPSLVFQLARENHFQSKTKTTEVVFVPSFSPGGAERIREACRDLSYATASLVVFVNCAVSDPRHAAFLAGKEISFVSKSTNSTDPQSRRVSASLCIHEIPYEAYHKARIDVIQGYSQIFNYLVGHKQGVPWRPSAS